LLFEFTILVIISNSTAQASDLLTSIMCNIKPNKIIIIRMETLTLQAVFCQESEEKYFSTFKGYLFYYKRKIQGL